MRSTAPRPVWISSREAANLLEVPIARIRKLVRKKAVKTFKLPGSRRLLDREEIENLGKQAIQPATIPA